MSKVERWLRGRLKDIRGFIEGLYEHDLHAKRVDALAGATLGVMTSASLAVAVIGQALAQARGLVTKHAIKQVDRLLSNQNVDARPRSRPACKGRHERARARPGVATAPSR
jgi:hypothetical protein